jgi:DNA repair ATPase RecN
MKIQKKTNKTLGKSHMRRNNRQAKQQIVAKMMAGWSKKKSMKDGWQLASAPQNSPL